MKQYICLKCNLVFQAGESYAKCCGKIEEFSPEKHGDLLVGLSNSWISVWSKWKDNTEFIKVSDELEGSFGAATAINVFIEELLSRTE